MGHSSLEGTQKFKKINHGFLILVLLQEMPEFLRKICNHLTEKSPFNEGSVGEIFFKTKRKEENCPQCSSNDWHEPEKSSASLNVKTSPPIAIPNIPHGVIPDGPIRFGSLGDGDAFIHKLLEEKHIETKEQLYKISLRPTSFDAKEELRARPQDGQSPQPQQQQSGSEDNMHVMTSKKVQRMHFIGSYNFLKSDDFEEEEARAYYDTNSM